MAHKQTPDRQAYRVNDVIAVLGISRRSVYRMIDRGTLRTTKVGGIRLIPAADVAAVVAGAEA